MSRTIGRISIGLCTVTCCLVASVAPTSAAQTPHPAVVRVVAPGRDSVSYGSGTLVDVGERHGLVITNWHVINEAAGPINVLFPDGFRSGATIQAVDRDWDLAALAIWRPNVEPVRLAMAAPRPGEMLTIAGYGSGSYRAVSGRCTQYVAPGQRFPFEMVELAASARQGDSGGPILNERGELAGVLFGEGRGRTAGSYCGRVQWFLAAVTERSRTGEVPLQVADARASTTAPQNQELRPVVATLPEHEVFAPRASDPAEPLANTVVSKPADKPADNEALAQVAPSHAFRANSSMNGDNRQVIGWRDIAGQTFGQQFKTILAAVGFLYVLLRMISYLGREPA